VLVEPFIFSPETYAQIRPALDALVDTVDKNILARKASWSSKDSALKFFKGRSFWKTWDERALLLHVVSFLCCILITFQTWALTIIKEYALTQDASGAQILKTSPSLEAASFWAREEAFAAMERLRKLSPMMPIHVVLGDRWDFM
jgi:hypothetical protein